MLGIQSSEAAFLFCYLGLRLQQLHDVGGIIFLSLGQFAQSSHNFERTLYMPPPCPTQHVDPRLV